VARHGGDKYAKKFSCWEQFLAMAFAQLTYRESLRDIEACLGAVSANLHMGFAATVARSTLADANENRDWRIFADFAQVLIGIAPATLCPANRWAWIWIKACTRWIRPPSISAWNCFHGQVPQTQGAVKMHTLLDLRGNISTFIRITDGKVHDVNILDELPIETGAFYVIDRRLRRF